MTRFSLKAPVAVVALASGVGLVAIAAVVAQQPKLAPEPRKPRFETAPPPVVPETRHTTHRKVAPEEPKPEVHEESVVRSVRLEGDEPKLDRTVALREGEDPKSAALQASIKALGLAQVRVLSTDLEKGVLTIDVSAALQAHGFGSSEESVFIKVIQLTLSQFSEVKSFRFRADGQVIDTLGHFEMTEPVPVKDEPTKDDSPSTNDAP